MLPEINDCARLSTSKKAPAACATHHAPVLGLPLVHAAQLRSTAPHFDSQALSCGLPCSGQWADCQVC